MDSFTLTTSCRVTSFPLPPKKTTFSFSSRPNCVVFASKDDLELDKWEQMELKFGRLLGEDPKLTLAKIAGRKANPDVSYLEIEKLFGKNKSQMDDVEFVEEFQRPPQPPSDTLKLSRPVPKKGVKFQEDVVDKQYDSPNRRKIPIPVDSRTKKSTTPDIVLRKPSAAYPEDDIVVKKPLRLTLKPNLSLKMNQAENEESFSKPILLKKPEPTSLASESDSDNVISGDFSGSASGLSSEAGNDGSESVENSSYLFSQLPEIQDKPTVGAQPLKQSDLKLSSKETSIIQPEVKLQGKPPRLDQSSKDVSEPAKEEAACLSSGHAEVESLIPAEPLKECEDTDWSRAEYICNAGGREVVELISCSTRGFVASFGSLVGFLPYRNLGSKWKFLAFESWLRDKGIDPAMYRQNLGIIGRYESLQKNLPNVANITPEKVEEKPSPNMKLEDLLNIYDQEKMKFLSSFIGLRLKVNVVLADRNSRKLIFSGFPKERGELVEKKRSLMEKLNVGDVVKCCIKKITYFGIFVEVEGVPALIHQSEVSWDATLDPSSSFKIDQIVEAKVRLLDISQDRIQLSLKDMTPDPLIEALESVVGSHNTSERNIEVAPEDIDWADVESLIKELEDIEGIQSVSKGRFLLSPGLAPTFQVYMASMFQNQYKLLARSGNKIQEVLVQASLDREQMKATIQKCTERVNK